MISNDEWLSQYAIQLQPNYWSVGRTFKHLWYLITIYYNALISLKLCSLNIFYSFHLPFTTASFRALVFLSFFLSQLYLRDLRRSRVIGDWGGYRRLIVDFAVFGREGLARKMWDVSMCGPHSVQKCVFSKKCRRNCEKEKREADLLEQGIISC